MKKILFICSIIISALLFSCTKSGEEDLATISINHRYVESGSMYTRSSIIVPEIEEAVSVIMPESIPLTITRDIFTVFSCQTGEDITLPFDCSYAVTGKSKQITTNIIEDQLYASPEPLVMIDDTINVMYGVKSYLVNATIGSFVLAWNNLAVQSVTIYGTTTALPSVNVGSTSVCCITGEGEFSVTLNPWENQPWEARTFDFTTFSDGNGIYCEPGKWYALSPSPKTTSDNMIGLLYNEWIEGGSYY